MSANIYWQAVKGRDLDVSAPSSFLEAMRKAFGDGQKWELSGRHLEKLSGMAAIFSGSDNDNPYLTIIDAISEHGLILVWAEW
jgi:hypothetical protein